jgi:hypothetical protein
MVIGVVEVIEWMKLLEQLMYTTADAFVVVTLHSLTS